MISSTHLLCCPSAVIRSRITVRDCNLRVTSGQVNHRSFVKHRLTGSQSQTVVVNSCYFKTPRLAQTVTVVVNHRHTLLTSTGVQRWGKEKETVWPKARNIEPIRWQLSALVASVELWKIFMGVLPLNGETWIYGAVAPVPSCFFVITARLTRRAPCLSLYGTLVLQQEDVNLVRYEERCLAAVHLH